MFRVRDRNQQHLGEFALKRVINPARHDQFRREIDAIKLLKHQNIISIIDHSALDENGADPDKQFIVMPIAASGDLSASGRLALYPGSIDSVLRVAKQISEALRVAHSAKIIHRDVKPQNILFTGNGHELWLSDFGICLIREASRITEEGEVVGAREFMAPELAYEGKLEVTPAADIYSLGKVIYYMISGGVTVTRELLHEERYRSAFAKGERHKLLDLLLRRMICGLEHRISTAEEALKELNKIELWEQTARLPPLSDGARALLNGYNADLSRPARSQPTTAMPATKRLISINSAVKFDRLADGAAGAIRVNHFIRQHQMPSSAGRDA